MPQKTIAVCIISYNQRAYLVEAIESVLTQTRMPDQIIVIDDASSDNTVEVLQSYQRQYPKLFTIKINAVNQGNGTNRHLGVLESRCDLTTYLDGDDLYYPEKLRLEEQHLADNPDAGFVYSNFNLIDSAGELIRPWATNPEEIPVGNVFEPLIAFEFPRGIQCRCPLTDTHALIEATKHAQGFILYEDFIIVMHLSRSMNAVVVNQINHGYRLHNGCVHRSHHEGHSNVLERIYTQNKALFENLDPTDRARIERKFRHILSQYAWRAVRDHAKQPSTESKNQVIKLAKRAMHHEPLALRPKHVVRVIATQLKAPKHPAATISN